MVEVQVLTKYLRFLKMAQKTASRHHFTYTKSKKGCKHDPEQIKFSFAATALSNLPRPFSSTRWHHYYLGDRHCENVVIFSSAHCKRGYFHHSISIYGLLFLDSRSRVIRLCHSQNVQPCRKSLATLSHIVCTDIALPEKVIPSEIN
jgi:hypothetical protein